MSTVTGSAATGRCSSNTRDPGCDSESCVWAAGQKHGQQRRSTGDASCGRRNRRRGVEQLKTSQSGKRFARFNRAFHGCCSKHYCFGEVEQGEQGGDGRFASGTTDARSVWDSTRSGSLRVHS